MLKKAACNWQFKQNFKQKAIALPEAKKPLKYYCPSDKANKEE